MKDLYVSRLGSLLLFIFVWHIIGFTLILWLKQSQNKMDRIFLNISYTGLRLKHEYMGFRVIKENTKI